EGDVQEAEAEAAIKAMFPAIRDCYVELRQRAPQARGRMLMTFKVRAAEANQGATGELFLKETQFTDPKYLTCVRSAIDAARFPVTRNVQGSVTVPLFLSPQDAGEPATP
ncbi:MAG: AgmX/PglI C-terminal domain-containing protein, partial [Deltaproteobacteria bacterium]|nr:AgmX/PglI C-terminal domain-containing protein [Deltaproteobacteria bacterium]